MNQQDVFGRIVKDKLSLQEGLCYGVLDWVFGCREYLVKRRSEKKETTYDGEFRISDMCLEIVDPVPAVDAAFPEEEEAKFFGKICRDKVTGYKGMCIGRYWTFYAEKQYCLQARYNKKRSKKPYALWVDEGRIEVVESKHAIAPKEVQTEYRGGVIDVPLPGHYFSQADLL